MAGAESQAGFYYQNIIAANYALELIEFGSPLRTITLENPDRARHIDDVIARYVDKTEYVQVKWSQENNTAFTLHNLVTAEENEKPLLVKLVRGYLDIKDTDGNKQIILFSTRSPGTSRQTAKGF